MLTKIISGGQTGVDRAALDVALELGIACGGFCPRGRLAEDGRISDRYPLTELSSRSYPVRTRRNVLEADATLILSVGEPSGGTLLTLNICRELETPTLIEDPSHPLDAATIRGVRHWLHVMHKGQVFNVAGPRESKQPGIYALARAFLLEVLRS